MIFCIAISYAIWVLRSRDSRINIHIPNIVKWYRNRSAKTTSSYILLFDHGRRLNSSVSNQANNRKLGRMLGWFCQYLFYIYAIWTWGSRDSHINKRIPKIANWYRNRWRKSHHRTTRCLDTEGDWIRQFQMMLNNRKICRISAYGAQCTQCSEPNTNDLWITIQLR